MANTFIERRKPRLERRDRRETEPNRWDRFLEWWSLRKLTWVLVGLALVAAVLGHLTELGAIRLAGSLDTLVRTYYANIASELFSILITVLVVDEINQRNADRERQAREEYAQELAIAERKRELTLQMSSPFNQISIEAIRIMRLRNWLSDGTLHDAYLFDADLQGAFLVGADLQRAGLAGATLREASLGMVNLAEAHLLRADLRGADLRFADLTSANLYAADLRGASLWNADLTGANLHQARFNGATRLPDGAMWAPDVDMTRFTDAAHPAHWQADRTDVFESD